MLFFYKKSFLSTKHHHTETLCLFTIFVSMSKPMSILHYLRDIFFILLFIFIMVNRIISSINTRLPFCLHFRTCPIVFDCNVDKKCE